VQFILAYDTIKDPRDLAEVIHLAAGFGVEVHLIGKSLDPKNVKVSRRLRSWRRDPAADPCEFQARRFDDVFRWAETVRARGFETVALTVEGGVPPWSKVTMSGMPGLENRGPPAGLAFLLGEETHGLSRRELAVCDQRWSIPLGPGGRFYTLGQTTAILLGGLLGGPKVWEKASN
jgi:tRNA G18 (ribose-2'-O)-methylase SpoU